MTPPPRIRDYYRDAVIRLRPMEILQGNGLAGKTERIRLTGKETASLTHECARRGILLYTWVEYSYGRALLETLGAAEIWMLTLESGRYPDWGNELRIAGNLTVGMPVRISGDMSPVQLQEDLDMLRSWPYLSESDIVLHTKWQGIYEGITSNRFLAVSPLVESYQKVKVLSSKISRSVTHSLFSLPTRVCSASMAWGRISAPIITNMISSPASSIPSFNHTRT